MIMRESDQPAVSAVEIPGMNYPEFEKLIRDVIHKVKNNLGGISGFATLLSRDLGEDSPHLHLLDQIQTSILRLDALIVDLMVLIRRPKLNPEDFSVKPLFNDLIAQFSERNKQKCKIAYDPESINEKMIMHADSFIFERIVLYLLNFIEYLNANLKQVHISRIDGSGIKVTASISSTEFSSMVNLDTKEMMTELESVEARLSFTILVKLIQAVGGRMHLVREKKTSFDLIIEIS
jgi:light-regulated signal transduction histidine kinase (bacteriophytochrome)